MKRILFSILIIVNFSMMFLNAQNPVFEKQVNKFLITEDWGELVNYLKTETVSLYVDSKSEKRASEFFVGAIKVDNKQVVAFGNWSNLIINEENLSIIIRLQNF